jgi:hypothetical protein
LATPRESEGKADKVESKVKNAVGGRKDEVRTRSRNSVNLGRGGDCDQPLSRRASDEHDSDHHSDNLGGVLGIVLIVLIVLWLVGGIRAFGPRS